MMVVSYIASGGWLGAGDMHDAIEVFGRPWADHVIRKRPESEDAGDKRDRHGSNEEALQLLATFVVHTTRFCAARKATFTRPRT